MTAQTEARAVARRLWTEHGGRQHGPRTETLTMPLDNFGGFVDALMAAKNAEIAALKKEAADVVRPFAEHLDEMKFDRDNNDNPLPDNLAVGWVYVTNGDFRATRSFLDKWEGRG